MLPAKPGGQADRVISLCKNKVVGQNRPEGRHGPTRVKPMPSLCDVAHDGCLCTFTNITAPGNSISSQLGSSCQGNRYGIEKAGGTARSSRTKNHTRWAGRRVGPALYGLY
jgi:hypothetical protein